MKKNLIVLGVVIVLFGAMGAVAVFSGGNAGPESVVDEAAASNVDGAVKICPHSGLPCDGDGDCESGDGCEGGDGCEH